MVGLTRHDLVTHLAGPTDGVNYGGVFVAPESCQSEIHLYICAKFTLAVSLTTSISVHSIVDSEQHFGTFHM